jgi:hypothetical protein
MAWFLEGMGNPFVWGGLGYLMITLSTKRTTIVFLLVLALAGFAGAVSAQVTTADILGTVSDGTGACGGAGQSDSGKSGHA